jgi:O-antigen ligase
MPFAYFTYEILIFNLLVLILIKNWENYVVLLLFFWFLNLVHSNDSNESQTHFLFQ